jgi:hypothetical protein
MLGPVSSINTRTNLIQVCGPLTFKENFSRTCWDHLPLARDELQRLGHVFPDLTQLCATAARADRRRRSRRCVRVADDGAADARAGLRRSNERRRNNPLLLGPRPSSAPLHRCDHLNLRLGHSASPRITPSTSRKRSTAQAGRHRAHTIKLLPPIQYRARHGRPSKRRPPMNHCKTDLGIQNRLLHPEICQSSARLVRAACRPSSSRTKFRFTARPEGLGRCS